MSLLRHLSEPLILNVICKIINIKKRYFGQSCSYVSTLQSWKIIHNMWGRIWVSASQSRLSSLLGLPSRNGGILLAKHNDIWHNQTCLFLHHIDLLLPLPLLTLYLTSYWIPIILLFTLQESLTCNKIFSGKENMNSASTYNPNIF